MATVDRTFYYYIILFATFLFTIGFIPIVFEILQQKTISIIPYISLIFIIISYIIYLFIAISRKYFFHSIIYLIGLIAISILLFLKKKYENKNKNINNVIINEEIIF